MALSFKQIREAKVKPIGDLVKKFKHKNVVVQIYKYKNEFISYLEGEVLDKYATEQEAVRMSKEFTKALKEK